MDSRDAKETANHMLMLLIKNQPGLIQYPSGSGPSGHGQDLATFCADFIDTYAAWLIKDGKAVN